MTTLTREASDVRPMPVHRLPGVHRGRPCPQLEAPAGPPADLRTGGARRPGPREGAVLVVPEAVVDPPFACWWCGEPAPGGVCPGPHPDYRPHSVTARRHVIESSAVTMGQRRKPKLVQSDETCVICGRLFVAKRSRWSWLRQTCSEDCLSELHSLNRRRRFAS